ncbi:hypothetical protein PM02_17930 [Sulfitobacter mediterraneus]|uniref:Uncharacterized protein n=1 Tax=Sulfitobacter mediterraneus TaxID=83219 RepID=A0A061SLJ6_9RHOB|nr:hypothetical protein PM02_17930 [Sulfitobacter mediterraneus]
MISPIHGDNGPSIEEKFRFRLVVTLGACIMNGQGVLAPFIMNSTRIMVTLSGPAGDVERTRP